MLGVTNVINITYKVLNYIDSSLLIKAINTDHFTFSLIISISLLTTLKNRALIWWFEVISITPGSSINHLYEVGIFGPQFLHLWKRKSGQNLHSWTWMLSSLALVFLKFSISTRSYILLSVFSPFPQVFPPWRGNARSFVSLYISLPLRTGRALY